MIPGPPSPSAHATIVKTPYEIEENQPPMMPSPISNGISTPPTPPPPPPLPPPPDFNKQSRSGSYTESTNSPVGENTPVLQQTNSSVITKKRKDSGHGHDIEYIQPKRRSACNESIHVLSSLYGKLLIVAATVLVTTEVLHNQIPLLFFHGYLYTYVIGGAVVCLMSIYICLMVDKCPTLTGDDVEIGGQATKRNIYYSPDVSIFLRSGMLIFGLGTLISSGLEIATVFTIPAPCTDEINMAQPILQALFIFLQMHFLFLNSQEAIRSLGWFRHIAIMHLTTANIALWLRMILWDTTTEWMQSKHIAHNFSQRWPPKSLNLTMHAVNKDGEHRAFSTTNCLWKSVDEKMEDLFVLKQCLQNSTVGSIWEMAEPYLAPFTVQYSLIAAAILYVFWENAGWDYRMKRLVGNCTDQSVFSSSQDLDKAVTSVGDPKKSSTRKIDCKGSSKGLFLGLLVLVAGLIIMILFFVLNDDHDLHFDTLFAVITMHCSVLGTSTLAVMLGLCQIQRLRFRFRRGRRLSDLVQGTAVLSVFAYGTASMVVGGTDIFDTQKMVLFIDGACMVFHAALQSLFIRQVIEKAYTPGSEQRRSRPGRQVVMYLVFTNFVLWLVELFTAQRHVASQLQLEFYGKLPWGVFTRIALPLVVFYRFHSAVVLMEAWRKSYKIKGG